MAAGPFADLVRLGEVVIVGGGCYGTFYASQLERARARGAAAYERLLVVDRDPGCRAARELPPDPARAVVVGEWESFFDEYLAGDGAASGADAIVPSPLMPHLMFGWLARRARARWPGREVGPAPLDAEVGTPYDVRAPDGTRYVSHADWLCPTHCIEPALCPIIRAPRSWDMGDTLAAYVDRLRRAHPTSGPVLFVTRHRVYGVGMFDVSAVREADRLVAEAGALGAAVDVVVGSISACHGAVSLLRLGPGVDRGPAGEP
jgi:hypothetical protein